MLTRRQKKLNQKKLKLKKKNMNGDRLVSLNHGRETFKIEIFSFKIKNATPRQGQLCPLARGKFEFIMGHNPVCFILKN
jgi:hypothetical protein